MLLTKECDYGIRVIRALADGEKRMVQDICKAENIPGQYAYKILKKLENTGFLESTRGRKGGYRLIKPLNTFNLYDIIMAMDENMFINACLRKDRPCVRNTSDEPCAVHNEFERVQKILIEELKLKTITEIVS